MVTPDSSRAAPPAHGLFITGTDTDVGKTVAAAMLALGLNGVYWKPIQCGIEPMTDREAVRRWTGIPEERLAAERYLLQAPLSPHAAAELEGISIEIEAILDHPVYKGRRADRPLIVEGAGGLLVPLGGGHTVADLIAAMGLPALVVARTALGTINHTLLTLAELRRRAIPVAGVLLNGEENVGNRRAIEIFGEVRVVGRIPPLERLDPPMLLEVFQRLDPGVLQHPGGDG